MPLETAPYITDLDATEPAHTDQINQADGHLRLIKSALKATLPNFTSAPLGASQADLDTAVAATKGTSALLMGAATGIAVAGDPTTRVYSPGTGKLNVSCEGVDVIKSTATGLELTQPLACDQPITGPGTLPVGGTIIWWSDTLPTGAGTFAWANGQTYLRSNTALWNIFGTTYGLGDGVTTANLPDLRDCVPVGKGTMGGASAAARIVAGVSGFTTSVLGAIFGSSVQAIARNWLPNITLGATVPAQTVTPTTPGSSTVSGGGSAPTLGPTNSSSVALNPITIPAQNIATESMNGNVTQAAANNVQPSAVCNYAIRIA